MKTNSAFNKVHGQAVKWLSSVVRHTREDIVGQSVLRYNRSEESVNGLPMKLDIANKKFCVVSGTHGKAASLLRSLI